MHLKVWLQCVLGKYPFHPALLLFSVFEVSLYKWETAQTIQRVWLRRVIHSQKGNPFPNSEFKQRAYSVLSDRFVVAYCSCLIPHVIFTRNICYVLTFVVIFFWFMFLLTCGVHVRMLSLKQKGHKDIWKITLHSSTELFTQIMQITQNNPKFKY